MSRAAEVQINLSALASNLKQVRKFAPDSRVVAVIKANGYGHGMTRVARALQDADAFAVASIDEALELRGAGIDHPILLLEGFFSADELALAQQYNFSVVVHQEDQVRALEAITQQQKKSGQHDFSTPIPVWLKVDTGMHRLGFAADQAASMVHRLQQCAQVAATITLMTHFASADERDNDTTARQVETFYQINSGIDWLTEQHHSMANSAAILAWPQTHFNDDYSWVRPGIMLYGVSPFSDATGQEHGLATVMTLCSRLIAIKELKAGDSVGYGGSWQCPEAMRVGVVAIGYGDGYPRTATAGTPVLVNGQRVPLIGRVSMDMISVDLRQQPSAQIGDEVVLWGEGLPIEEVARHAGTIPYDLLCALSTRVRVIETGNLVTQHVDGDAHDYQSKAG